MGRHATFRGFTASFGDTLKGSLSLREGDSRVLTIRDQAATRKPQGQIPVTGNGEEGVRQSDRRTSVVAEGLWEA
jgi:hypothetical protein